MNVAVTAYIIFQVLIAIYFLFPFILYIISGFKIKKNKKQEALSKESDYAIIVTAYEQIDLIPNVVDSILQLNYTNYLVYVVADKCDISTLKFTDPRVILLRPEETLSSNIKSHFYAIQQFQRGHERLTIIDSDNLVHPDYLAELDKIFDEGYLAVQGVREAKNLNSEYACLDAAGDIYYRYVDRKLLYDAGSSAALSGSGMAFTTKLYKDCLENSPIRGAGFDKILQYEIIRRKFRIAFSGKAIVYDEKTSKSDQLVKQRARWINTWFRFFLLGLKMNISGILRLNWNQFAFSCMLLRPPLFILLGAAFFCFLVDVFLLLPAAFVWLLLFLLFIYIFFCSLSYFKADKKIYRSLINIPKFIYYQVVALLKIRKANKISVATEHFYEGDNT